MFLDVKRKTEEDYWFDTPRRFLLISDERDDEGCLHSKRWEENHAGTCENSSIGCSREYIFLKEEARLCRGLSFFTSDNTVLLFWAHYSLQRRGCGDTFFSRRKLRGLHNHLSSLLWPERLWCWGTIRIRSTPAIVHRQTRCYLSPSQTCSEASRQRMGEYWRYLLERKRKITGSWYKAKVPTIWSTSGQNRGKAVVCSKATLAHPASICYCYASRWLDCSQW